MAVPPDVHVFGKLNNIVSPTQGQSQTNIGSVTITLAGYGSQIPRVISEANFSRVSDLINVTGGTTDNGTFAAYLYNNALIHPDGTYYTFSVANENGDVTQVNAFRFTTAGDFDLDSLIPYDPNQPPPALPPLVTNLLLILGASQFMAFPGDIFTAFKTTLPGDVTNPSIVGMVPGNLYTFIIVQDGAGNHLFLWPTTMHNATRVSPTPNSTTVQTFIADENGELWAIGPGTWSL